MKRIATYVGLFLLGLIGLIQVVAVLGADGFVEKFVRLLVAGLIFIVIVVISKKIKGR